MDTCLKNASLAAESVAFLKRLRMCVLRALGIFFRYLLGGAWMTAATTKCMMYIRNWITILGYDMWKAVATALSFLLISRGKGSDERHTR